MFKMFLLILKLMKNY
jgi:hypothetical protein